MKTLISTLALLLGVVMSLMAACDVQNATEDDSGPLNYRHEMRTFIQNIRNYAVATYPNFEIIPQNGQELITVDGEASGTLAQPYAAIITGQAREDLFYGYTDDNVATPTDDRDYILAYLNRCESVGVEVMVIDYCSTQSFVNDSYAQSNSRSFISFAADHRALDNIPSYPAQPDSVSADNITSLAAARNFLYLINPDFADKQSFLQAVSQTDYDAIVVDLFFWEEMLTASDVASLKQKHNGGTRLVLCYMSIGEAEDYRYYWQSDWSTNPPAWLGTENPDWPGNYKVQYWDPSWQAIITGNETSYLHRIVSAGFDGVYLDLVDAFEYFENLP